MPAKTDMLTDKEKETLRLLLVGHDAKSIANQLNLSVHTINDRLREARRKLDVTSSREAARILASEEEEIQPNNYVHKEIGVADNAAEVHHNQQPAASNGMGHIFILIVGGILMLSLITAVVISAPFEKETTQPSSNSVDQPITVSSTASESASINAARSWLVLIDNQNWSKSWGTAGAVFRSNVSKKAWAKTMTGLQKSMGSIVARSVHKVTKTNALPGAAKGQYEVIEFRSNFTKKKDAIETVVLVRENSGWNVVGYFIR